MTFNETIHISGNRRGGAHVSTSVLARTVDDGINDGVEAEMRANNCEMLTFFIRAADWPYQQPPQTGDNVQRADVTTRYRVGRVTRLGDCYSLNARSR